MSGKTVILQSGERYTYMDKYQEIKEAFELLRDEVNAKKMSSYMRNKFKYCPC